ncbi:hypothetical protein QRB41_14450 [Mycobacterium avium subsp. hominissuis]|uniref:hypothetical protein n=1 Tax=Mycobacterium avium TaxID=1764 RepID=UPI00049ED622|nr:hypothetical protein [Mycobacterium avium]KDP00457.1 hypothetical protein MAV100_25125 [Mycobacterium avium subsp. hominissuis 100]MBZ4571643.1 hypothetical protein [Mycobacterium avium subsp. hominissuis]MDO2384594.1 hypothetical protein [Mycobacterium avium subsp. hominissuis]
MTHSDNNAIAIASKLADSIEFGQPWVVQDRHIGATAVAIKKSGGRDDEIIWDYTFPDGSGHFCDPEAFVARFTPVTPMAAIPTQPPQPSGDRATELQIALWTALAGPFEIHGPTSAYVHLQELVDQIDDRADAFPAVLSALIAERAIVGATQG